MTHGDERRVSLWPTPSNTKWDAANEKPPDSRPSGGLRDSAFDGLLRQVAADRGEGAGELGAHGPKRGHEDHSDQGGDQTIFDGRGPALVFPETPDELAHRKVSFYLSR